MSSEEEIKNIERKVKQYKTKNEINREIEYKNVSAWEDYTDTIGSMQKGNDILRNLVKDKVNDEQLLNDIIKNADVVLRHRISSHISLLDEENNVKAKILSVGILPNEIWEIKEHFEGTIIDPTGYANRITRLETKLKDKYGINTLKTESDGFPDERFGITKIKIRFEFA